MSAPALVGGIDTAALRIQVLGGFGVTLDGHRVPEETWRSQKAQHLIKLLALSPALSLARDEIIDALWPDSEPAAVADTCYQTIYYARRALDPGRLGLLSTRRGLVTLRHPGGVAVDLAAFQTAAAAARRQHEPAAYGAALALYTGDLLPADRYEDWASGPRDAAQRLAQELLLSLAHLQEERRDWPAAAATLARLLAADPANEEGHVALMRVHARSGRRRQAVAQFQRLREALREVEAPPDAASQRLYAAILSGQFPGEAGGEPAAPPAAPLAALPAPPRHNLPAPLTALIGRAGAIAAVRDLLAGARLVTLVGAGGSGKTRLGLAVARDQLGAFPDGVWLVELAGLRDGALVPSVIGRTLGIADRPDRAPAALLVEHLRGRSALLLLDNCEQVLADCAAIAATLLTACPGVRVVATSRAPLRVAGEIAWRVPSLPPPALPTGPVTPGAVAEARANPAVRLFLDRARQAAPGFALTAENLIPIATICRRLEGLPLALELAAAWVPSLALDQLAARLDRALHLLVAGDRSAPTRHQTLRATLDWSHDLLPGAAQALLGRLAVFVGGWGLAAAEEVIGGAAGADPPGADPTPREAVLPLLALLVEHSLVGVEAVADGLRYRLLEPVRQYALERLAASGEADGWRERHARHFLALAESAAPRLLGADQASDLARLERDSENLRAALAWWAERGEDEAGLRLASALLRFWRTGNRTREGRTWLVETFVARAPGLSPLVRARALNASAFLAIALNDFARALGDAGEALDLCRDLGDRAGEFDALDRLGIVAVQHQDDLDAAAGFFGAARDLALADGDEHRLVTAMGNLAALHFYRDDYPTAERELVAQLERARALADPTLLRIVLLNLSIARLGQRKSAGTRALLVEGVGLCTAAQDWPTLSFCLIALALLANQDRQAGRAASLLGASAAIRAAADLPLPQVQYAFSVCATAEARYALGHAGFDAAFANGRSWDLARVGAAAGADAVE